MARSLTLFCVAVCLAASLPAQQVKEHPWWKPLEFLLGEWVAEGSGHPGQGSGSFSHALELQGKILVRKNRVDYPATKERPAYHHEDLLVIFPDPGGKRTRAMYWDNEGHVILYTVESSPDSNRVTLVSDPSPSEPRYRFSYAREGADWLGTKFEIAPAGKPDSFSTYVTGTAQRKKP